MGREFDSGWIGAGADDDLDRRLAAEAERFDLRRPHVMTVLGAIEPAALGVALLQPNLVPRPRSGAPDSSPAIDPEHALLADLEDLYAAGGRAVVAATPDADGDLASLLWAAARAPVHVVATTGTSLRAPAATGTGDPGDTAVAALAAGLVRELTDGIAGTSARAGAIAVRMGAATVAGAGEAVARAAALAHAATGAPVIAWIDWGAPAAPLLAFLEAEKVAPERIVAIPDAVVGAADLGAVLGEHGVFVLLGAGSGGDLVGAVAALVAAGFGDRILLAGAATRSSPLRADGGPGLAAVLDRLPIQLMEAGLDALAVRRLLVDNPARALTIGTEEP